MLLFSFYFCETINIIYYYFYSCGGEISTLNMMMILMNWSISSWYIYTNDLYNLTKENRAIIEIWCKIQVFHATLCFVIITIRLSTTCRDTFLLALRHVVQDPNCRTIQRSSWLLRSRLVYCWNLNGTLVTKFYLVQYPFCLWMITSPRAVKLTKTVSKNSHKEAPVFFILIKLIANGNGWTFGGGNRENTE